MAVQVSPAPNEGALSAKGPNITLTVSTTALTTMSAHVATPLGPSFAIATDILVPGSNVVTLSLPPGGVPPGSTLSLVFVDTSGATTVVRYHLQ